MRFRLLISRVNLKTGSHTFQSELPLRVQCMYRIINGVATLSKRTERVQDQILLVFEP